MPNNYTVEKIVIYDRLDNNRAVAEITNPPADEFELELNVGDDKEVELYAVAYIAGGFYSKASDPVKLKVNRANGPVTFNPPGAERVSTENITVYIVYSISAGFSVTNDFVFQLEYKSINNDTWSVVSLVPDKNGNNFTARYEIPSAESGLYDFRCKRLDKYLNPSVYTPIKQINKNAFLGYTEGADNFYFGWVDTDNFKVQY